MIRVSVDFNTMMTDEEERVLLNTDVDKNLLPLLHPGLLITVYDEELEVEASVEYVKEHRLWLGRPNWATRRDLLQDTP